MKSDNYVIRLTAKQSLKVLAPISIKASYIFPFFFPLRMLIFLNLRILLSVRFLSLRLILLYCINVDRKVTVWCRGQAPVFQLLRKSPAFYGNRNFITVFTRASHWSRS
jgi:hypothetical protein